MTESDLRERMVDEQIVRRGISDVRVLEAMRSIPRHLFVPPEYRQAAYEDRPLPIGERQTISQPSMVAEMLAALGLKGGERVLEIGAGSGYVAALLSKLAREVVSVERLAPLADKARRRLEELTCTNVTVSLGDGTLGWPEQAPYDAILLSAGAPAVPDSLTDQLADGGVLVAPIGGKDVQRLTVVRRSRQGRLTVESRCECVFVPLIGAKGWPPHDDAAPIGTYG